MRRFDEFSRNGKILALLYLCVLVGIMGGSLNYIVNAAADSVPVPHSQEDDNQGDLSQDEPFDASDNDKPTDETVNHETDISQDASKDQSDGDDSQKDQSNGDNALSENGEASADADNPSSEEMGNSNPEEEEIYTQEDLETLSNAVTTIYFESQSFNISKEYEGLLQSFIVLIKQYPEESITIEGYANGYPHFTNSNLDLTLSQERIDAVKEYFKDYGVNLSGYETINYGSGSPVSRLEDQQALNDKVIIYFTDHSPHLGNKK